MPVCGNPLSWRVPKTGFSHAFPAGYSGRMRNPVSFWPAMTALGSMEISYLMPDDSRTPEFALANSNVR
jgi:hypothetical protein